MKNEKLVRSIGSVDDGYIKEAAPGNNAARRGFQRKRLLRWLPAAACIAVTIIASTAFAASYVQNSLNSFYLRYLSPEDMAVANSMAEHHGVKIYFDGLKSDDWYTQYFAINKLVEYYNDDKVRLDAIKAIKPFLESEDPQISDAAVFALSVLEKRFDDPRIIHLANGSKVFALFNDYSDYGTYNRIWMIEDDEMRLLIPFDRPMMYISQMLPSPDSKLFAVMLISNKSSYLFIWDDENGFISPELVDSARVMVARELDIDYWARIDFENYSTVRHVEWTDDGTIEFNVSMSYNGGEYVKSVTVSYNIREKQMECVVNEE